MRTLEQDRAADALQRVQELLDKEEGMRERYRAYVERLGPAILMNGLGQALATELAAGQGQKADAKAHLELFKNLERWLCRERGVYPPEQGLLKAITLEDEAHYLRAQAEALAWLEWHKKFCRAWLPREP
jgi:CRISPR-associated protein Cmr5